MKTKKLAFLSFVAMVAIGFSLSSCQKDKTKTTSSSLNQAGLMQQSASDDQTVQDAQAAVVTDATNYISGLPLPSTKGDTIIPCGIKNITINKEKNIFHIKYNGINCDAQRIKTGDITIQLLPTSATGASITHWRDQGAIIQISYDVSVTRTSSSKTYTLKGVKTITNVNGGLIWGAIIDSNKIISHIVNGTDTITFPDGTTRTWEHNIQRTWQHVLTVWTLTTAGLGTDGNYSSLATWGVNRKGDNFYTQITTPVISSNVCLWAPSQGVVTHTIVSTSTSESASVTLTFGVDASGNPVTTTCALYYKISWIAKDGKTGTAVLLF